MVELFPGIINSFLKSGYCFEARIYQSLKPFGMYALQAFSLFSAYVLTGYLQLRGAKQRELCWNDG